MPRALGSWGSGWAGVGQAWVGALLVTTGCAATAPESAPPPGVTRVTVPDALCAPPASALADARPAGGAQEAQADERLELVLTRVDEEGRPAWLRAVVDPDGLGPVDPVAVHDAATSAHVRLAPGRYHVLVFADPGPFGFDVLLSADRPRTDVLILSAADGHTVLVDRMQPLGNGLTLVERQLVGFGWGPRPEQVLAAGEAARDARGPAGAAEEARALAESEALRRATLDRIRRALVTAGARRAALRESGAPVGAETELPPLGLARDRSGP